MQARQTLLLIGCGHTHALALLNLRYSLPDGVDLIVADPNPRAVYSGMLPGFVAGHYPRDALDIDIANLTRPMGATFHAKAATELDLDANTATLADGSSIPFDVASIDIGITARMPSLPGFAEHAIPAKPLAGFAAAWQDFVACSGTARIAVIGAGVAGAELSLAMAHALSNRNRAADIHLIDRGTALSALTPRPRKLVLQALLKNDITLHENTQLGGLSASTLHLAGRGTLTADLIVGAAGATPHPWLGQTGLKTTNGFLTTDAHLQTSHPRLFAAGDCAHFAPAPLPKAGVYAVRQAPVLAQNLRAALTGDPLTAYTPQTDYLKLISLGAKRAVANKHGLTLSGTWAWRLKNWIDTGFMARFR